MTDFSLQRRTFLQLGFAAALLHVAPARSAGFHASDALLSARTDAGGQNWCVSYALDGTEHFRTPVPIRCHDVVPHPFLPLVAFVARRPGRQVFLLDSRDGRIVHTLQARDDRHFYGHGLFEKDGSRLYLVENDTSKPGRGVMGVYNLKNDTLVFEREMPTHGIEPHQFAWLPDYSGFAIANGGVRTEANSREAIDDVVESSLVVMRKDGTLLSHETLADPRSSIRHVAVASDGTLVTGQQYVFAKGSELDDGFVPEHGGSLIAIKRPQQSLSLFPLTEEQMEGVNYYSASITVNNDLRWLAASAPRGNRLQIWHLDTAESLLDWRLQDCAGIAAVEDGFVASSGQQACFHASQDAGQVALQRLALPVGGWDNHCIVRAA